MSWEQAKDFGFGHPWWLLLLPLLFWWFRRLGRVGPGAAIVHSSTNLLARLGNPRRGGPGKILRGLRLFALVILVLALARPRVPSGEANDPNKGIDIMLVCDVSLSMDTQDFTLGSKKITRREALLEAISEFVDGRKDDRIGMVGFAKYVYLLSPMTTDGNWIKNVFKLVELKNGTAIGDGLFAAVDKMQEFPGRSKVIILVTDGLNNQGRNPIDAGKYAKEKKVRIYALEIKDIRGIRTSGLEKSPLSQIATSTGGQYFQAADTGALMQIYRQIDRMEKREYDSRRFLLFNELHPWFLGAAMLLLLFEWIASQTFWVRLP